MTDQQDASPSPGEIPTLDPLEAEVERLRGEVDRYRDDMLRARAELENVRKRAQRDTRYCAYGDFTRPPHHVHCHR